MRLIFTVKNGLEGKAQFLLWVTLRSHSTESSLPAAIYGKRYREKHLTAPGSGSNEQGPRGGGAGVLSCH